MDRVHKITSLGGAWKPGDVVLTADGELRIRATNNPIYPWGYPNEGSLRSEFGEPHFEGALREEDVARPLTLLVRDGIAVGGRLVEENELP
ncbi:hypothetical protein [Streptomyces antarcticus]|uniref:hypothetical protein n=1 Tax=Streptomyces antarcticus TaxID=2996458 RepID=UPI002270FF40|nr:hypothetical protein [Streptomyces sp. H34-AA3]MCY0947168.1 hypothetical protein [Streptomyces sp. H34-AA3]